MSSDRGEPTAQPATLALHGGEDRPPTLGDPLTPSICTATSFHTHPDAGGFSADSRNNEAASTPFYARWSHPTVAILERRLAALEGAEAAVCCGSGMAAVATLFYGRLAPGDHLIVSEVCYAGVAELAHELARFGVSVSSVDTADADAVRSAIRINTRLIHIETPSNPILKLSDVEQIAQISHASNIELSVDATLASVIGIRPLELGADYVIHSLTKYASGHGDVMGGVVLGRAAPINALRNTGVIHAGAVLEPFSAWLILRGLETLPARMQIHQSNARALAHFLESHPRIARVYYPGLDSHPQAALARRQLRNCSGIIAFTAPSSLSLARHLAERLQLISYAVSLGKTRSLLYFLSADELLKVSYRLDATAAARYRLWTGEGTFRLSVGLEDPADLIADLTDALAS